jgi:glycosyltransferase involved in cell wall biosynthesis
MEATRVVLHVLPHPGGGGEKYVDALAEMDGYRFERAFLASSARLGESRVSILRRAAQIQRRAHEFDLLHVHGEVAGAFCLPALAAYPSVVTLHGLHLLRRLDGVQEAAAMLNLRLIARAASHTICVSQAEYNDVQGVVSSRTLRRVVVIRNGVRPLEPLTPDERERSRARFGIPQAATVGAWIGSLDERKDPLTPIEAMREVARAGVSARLLLAGEGPLRTEIERTVSRDGLPVHVLGFRRDVRDVLAAADFFVLSSSREGLSFALLEAMSLGLVPVVSDVPGNPEAVGDTGIVLQFGDAAAFAEAFSRLAADKEERRGLGARARDRIERGFRLDEMLENTRRLYGDVLQGPRRRHQLA